MTALLKLDGVTAFYGAIQALRGVDLDVMPGEIVTLIGANGAGKSTLMMTICGSPQARHGRILLDGTDSPIIGVDVRGAEIEGFRVGMRVQAVWRPPEERSTDDMDNRWGGAWESVIERWEPTGEPDDDPRPLQQYAF